MKSDRQKINEIAEAVVWILQERIDKTRRDYHGTTFEEESIRFVNKLRRLQDKLLDKE